VVWLDELVRLWELYLRYGGFPASVAAALAGRPVPEWFTDALFAVVHADAFATSHLSETQTTALIDRLWASISTPVNLTNIGSDVAVDKNVVSRHVGYLRDAYLLWSCPRLDKPWLPNDKAQDKLYPIDPLLGRLAHLRNAARQDLDPTVLAEAQIGMALRRAMHATGRSWTADADLFYVRTPSRKEIDFVGEALAGAAGRGKIRPDRPMGPRSRDRERRGPARHPHHPQRPGLHLGPGLGRTGSHPGGPRRHLSKRPMRCAAAWYSAKRGRRLATRRERDARAPRSAGQGLGLVPGLPDAHRNRLLPAAAIRVHRTTPGTCRRAVAGLRCPRSVGWAGLLTAPAGGRRRRHRRPGSCRRAGDP